MPDGNVPSSSVPLPPVERSLLENLRALDQKAEGLLASVSDLKTRFDPKSVRYAEEVQHIDRATKSILEEQLQLVESASDLSSLEHEPLFQKEALTEAIESADVNMRLSGFKINERRYRDIDPELAKKYARLTEKINEQLINPKRNDFLLRKHEKALVEWEEKNTLLSLQNIEASPSKPSPSTPADALTTIERASKNTTLRTREAYIKQFPQTEETRAELRDLAERRLALAKIQLAELEKEQSGLEPDVYEKEVLESWRTSIKEQEQARAEKTSPTKEQAPAQTPVPPSVPPPPDPALKKALVKLDNQEFDIDQQFERLEQTRAEGVNETFLEKQVSLNEALVEVRKKRLEVLEKHGGLSHEERKALERALQQEVYMLENSRIAFARKS